MRNYDLYEFYREAKEHTTGKEVWYNCLEAALESVCDNMKKESDVPIQNCSRG